MIATKEQERKALEKIKKIVDDLGEVSYIGMAFEGCFEIAEDNINNDFGCSFKSNLESARKANEKMAERVKSLMENVDDLTTKLDDALKEVAWLRGKVLSHEYIEHLKVLVLNENKKAASQQTEAANKILDLAETPDTPEFREAVKARKFAIRREMKMQDIMEALVEMQEEKE